jgi:predicted Holliday junction resolvase-like endonuclease
LDPVARKNDLGPVVFIEIKTGRSALSAREKAVKKAAKEKKVSWRVFNPDVEVDRQRIPITTTR